MGLGHSVLQMLIMSATLALWELIGKPLFFKYAETKGVVGFGTTTLAYFIVILIGYVIARIVTRKKTTE